MRNFLKATSATALVLAASLFSPVTAGSAVALAALAATPACAQEPVKTTDADPALWVVKDKDTTVYLFGTIHLLKPGLGWFDEEVKAAFDRSSELVTEIVEPDPAAMQGMVMKLAVDSDGPPLTEKLSETDRAEYKAAMEKAGLPWQAFERFKPWMAGITLAVAPLPKLGYDPNAGVDKLLGKAAKDAGKPQGQLETAEQQLGFFDALSEPSQLAFLNATVDDIDEMGPVLDRMVAAWAKGDPEALGLMMNESLTETPEIAKLLLADRNARWADWIDARLDKPGTVFVAVGAGHLSGGDSVQAMLKKRKIGVKRVKY